MVYCCHMKTLQCKDISGKDCPFVAEGETDEEVSAKLKEHGHTVHPDMMSGMSDEEKAAMETKIAQRLTEQA